MSYSRRGSSCIPQTIAYTSAHKYLPPKAPVYKQTVMYMYTFPGTTDKPHYCNHINTRRDHPRRDHSRISC